jgi:multiple antibiotic resistance protein
MEILLSIAVNSLYLLAFINPMSKIAVLSGLSSSDRRGQLPSIVRKSSITAAGILLGLMVFGDFTLKHVFRVELHALQISGGVVLFWVGFNALRKGVFFEEDTKESSADLAIVPLACPMIAGPATIAASIALVAREGLLVPSISVLSAILVNAILMRFAVPIAALLKKLDLLSALIRITGLIVMTIGAQMVLDGLSRWKGIGSP